MRQRKSASRERLHNWRPKKTKLTDTSSFMNLRLKNSRKLKKKFKRRRQFSLKNSKRLPKNRRRSMLKLLKPVRRDLKILQIIIPARLSRKSSTQLLTWKLKSSMTALILRNAIKSLENLDNLLKLSQESKQQPSMKKRKPKQLQLPRLFHPLVKALMLNLVNSLDLRVKRVKLWEPSLLRIKISLLDNSSTRQLRINSFEE